MSTCSFFVHYKRVLILKIISPFNQLFIKGIGSNSLIFLPHETNTGHVVDFVHYVKGAEILYRFIMKGSFLRHSYSIPISFRYRNAGRMI
jgi:hypothetical protein